MDGFGTQRRFVRVLDRHANGLVEFEFAVGDPRFAVELVMPLAAFDEFCAGQGAEFLPEETAGAEIAGSEDDDPWSWTLHAATHRRFRT